MGASDSSPLRVMFIAGSLENGGAEKQFLYMVDGLQKIGAQLQILSLARGENNERNLEKMGIQPQSIGDLNPPQRLAQIVQAARAFRPHFIQATHFFASFYAGLAGRLTGIPSIGAIRGDLVHDQAGIGRGSSWLMRLPDAYIANSYNARDNYLRQDMPSSRIHILQNVIDIQQFDRSLATPPKTLLNPDRQNVITVARLIPVKRLERFILGLALARREAPELQGIIVGGGPLESHLKSIAEQQGLSLASGDLQFLGEHSDIAQLLAQSNLFVLTSDREGFPNVLLEAMAASLPVLTTPAGECRTLVQDGVNGYLLPFNDHQALADRLVELVRSPDRRRMMGNAGRRMVENQFNYENLAGNLVAIYKTIACQKNCRPALQALSSNDAYTQSSKIAASISNRIQNDR